MIQPLYHSDTLDLGYRGGHLHIQGNQRKLMVWLRGITIGTPDSREMAAIRKQGRTGEYIALHNERGYTQACLPAMTRKAVEEALELARIDQAEADQIANLPENCERRRIDSLYDQAESAEHASYYDPERIIKARMDAEDAHRAWRAKYPKAAALEQAANLRAKAAKQRSLASGALVFDMDGSLNEQARQERHDKFLALAQNFETQALEIEQKQEVTS